MDGLSGEAWFIGNPAEQAIRHKMQTIGTPLKEWEAITLRSGITTGYNKAFIIDNETREVLVEADLKSIEVIKPILRGRDVRRWRAQWAKLWLIYARKGIKINLYPAVYNYLQKYKKKLSRKSGTIQWYELLANPSDEAKFAFKKKTVLDGYVSPWKICLFRFGNVFKRQSIYHNW